MLVIQEIATPWGIMEEQVEVFVPSAWGLYGFSGPETTEPRVPGYREEPDYNKRFAAEAKAETWRYERLRERAVSNATVTWVRWRAAIDKAAATDRCHFRRIAAFVAGMPARVEYYPTCFAQNNMATQVIVNERLIIGGFDVTADIRLEHGDRSDRLYLVNGYRGNKTRWNQRRNGEFMYEQVAAFLVNLVTARKAANERARLRRQIASEILPALNAEFNRHPYSPLFEATSLPEKPVRLQVTIDHSMDTEKARRVATFLKAEGLIPFLQN